MAASGTTPRRQLKFPKPADAFAYCADFQALAESLDHDAETAQDIEANRSAAKTSGRLFVTQGDTPTKNALLYWDQGASWLKLPAPALGKGNSYVISEEEDGNLVTNPSSTRAQFVVISVKVPLNPSNQSGFGLEVNGVALEPQFQGFLVTNFFLPPGGNFSAKLNFFEGSKPGHLRVAMLEL